MPRSRRAIRSALPASALASVDQCRLTVIYRFGCYSGVAGRYDNPAERWILAACRHT